jgi:hypothetical protein
MSNVKQDVEQLLNKLPDDSSIEDIQYHLYVLDKVRRGLEDARANGTLSQEEVEVRLSKWLTEWSGRGVPCRMSEPSPTTLHGLNLRRLRGVSATRRNPERGVAKSKDLWMKNSSKRAFWICDLAYNLPKSRSILWITSSREDVGFVVSAVSSIR